MNTCEIKSNKRPELNPVIRKKQFLRENPNFTTKSKICKPRDTCPDCQEGIYLKWGPVRVNPYWSHFQVVDGCRWNGRSSIPAGETEEHMDAKKIAQDQLLFEADVKTTCTVCKMESVSRMPFIDYECEVRQERNGAVCVWDVAGKNKSSGEIEVGLEIRHTHAVENTYARRFVWWAEVSAMEVIEKQGEEIPKWTNIRKDQVCMDKDKCIASSRERTEKEQREKDDEAALMQMIEDKKETERNEKELKIRAQAQEIGYYVDGRFTDIVDLRDEKKRKVILEWKECIWCASEKELEHVPYCWDCRRQVVDEDKKRVIEWGKKSGIYSNNKWILKPPDDNCENEWLILRWASKCAVCQIRCRSTGGYSEVFPFCKVCYENRATPATAEAFETRLANEKLFNPSKEDSRPKDDTPEWVKRYLENNKRQPTSTTDPADNPKTKKAKIATKGSASDAPVVDTKTDEYLKTEEILSRFDGNPDFGPCLGITRLVRWQRAQKFDLQPPEEIKKILDDDIANNKPPKHQQARRIEKSH